MYPEWAIVISLLVYYIELTLTWPTLKAALIHHTEIFDVNYIEYNITPTKFGSHDVYINIRKNNMRLFTTIIIEFETNKDEYGIQFINKTFDTCKFYASRRYEPLFHLIYDGVSQNPSSFLPERCPIKTGVYHYLNASFETDKVPPISTGTKGIRMTIRYFSLEKHEDMKSILWMTFYFKTQRK